MTKKASNYVNVGTICTLTKNDSLIFRLTGTNEQGYPMSDYIVYKRYHEKPYVQVGKAVVVAYTTWFEPATTEQVELFNELTKRM